MITFTSESEKNMKKAIREYGKHHRYVVAKIVTFSSEGNKYAVLADFKNSPSFRTLKILIKKDYIYEDEEEKSKEEIKKEIEKIAEECIVIDTKIFK